MGKGDTPRPLNLERYRENYDRMFGRRCIKHRRTECADCFPPAPREQFKVGDRVYVRELDVFGKIATQIAPGVFDIVCEPPMPNYVWQGGEQWLRPASDYDRD